MARLGPQQKQQFDDAQKAFAVQHYADALVVFRRLLTEFPGDTVLLKFASEAALNVGDSLFAVNELKTLEQANPDDWQAAALLTRACAESGETSCRDSGIAHLADLHNRGITPAGMNVYIVERAKVGENTLLIRMSLEPWEYYRVYAQGQVINSGGNIFFRATLESNDTDQPRFAKEHPEEAARGVRLFSLDGYQETGLNSSGQRTQTHYTYKFYIGQPSYEVIREEFVKIASGKGVPMSSRSGLIVPGQSSNSESGVPSAQSVLPSTDVSTVVELDSYFASKSVEMNRTLTSDAGGKAINCGTVGIQEDPRDANDCVRKALSQKKPFSVRYKTGSGRDRSNQEYVGLNGRADGTAYEIVSRLFPCNDCGGSGRYEMKCAEPVQLHTTDFGTLTCTHLPPSAQSRKVLYYDKDGIEIIVQDFGTDVMFSFLVPLKWFPAITVDMDQNGKPTPNVDVQYGLLDGGTSCIRYIYVASSNSKCGTFKSASSLQITQLANSGKKRVDWRIPKKEISHDGKSVQFFWEIWDHANWVEVHLPETPTWRSLATFSFVLPQHAAQAQPALPPALPRDDSIHPSVQAGQQANGAYRVGGSVRAPKVIYSVNPAYTEEARRNKFGGIVVLRLIVGTDGRADDVSVSRSLGMGLDEKAVEAVSLWRFEPGQKDGKAVPVEINIQVNFSLHSVD